jgi:hypothetical protein
MFGRGSSSRACDAFALLGTSKMVGEYGPGVAAGPCGLSVGVDSALTHAARRNIPMMMKISFVFFIASFVSPNPKVSKNLQGLLLITSESLYRNKNERRLRQTTLVKVGRTFAARALLQRAFFPLVMIVLQPF